MKSFNVGRLEEANFPLGTAYINIACAGNSSSPSPQIPTVDQSLRIVVVANYVDASNFGVTFPYLNNGLVAPVEVDIFANGPNGQSITVFLPSGYQFVDGSTSIAIPCGRGNKFTVIGRVGVLNSPVIGYI